MQEPKQVDSSLIADAETVAWKAAHKMYSLIHRYRGAAEFLTYSEFERCERELRAAVAKLRADMAEVFVRNVRKGESQ